MATLAPKLIVFYLMIIGAALASGFTRTKPGQWIMDPEERKAASLRPGNDYVWACYDEYFVIENRCYKFESQVASWAEAQLICQKEGGALASLETWKNFPLVLKHLSSNEKGQFWFSAAFLRGKWRWTKTGQPIKPHWFGEFSGSWYDDNCAYFDTVSNAFKNGDCRAYKKYVCERPTEKVFLNGKFSHADRRPPRGGQADKNQGDALPLSSNTGDEIHTETPRPPQSEEPLPSSSQDTLGSDGEIFPHGDLPHGGDDSQPGPYLKNEKGIENPSPEEKREKDSSVQNDASGNVHSTTTTKVVDSCSPDYNLLAGKCFRFHDEETEWVEAYHACSNEGAELASIRTEKEFSEINSFLQRMSNKEYWLSGAYFDDGWVWATDREPMDRQWFGRRPRRAAFMCSYVTSTDEGYFDGLCSKKFGYICERPSEKVEVNVDVPKGMSDDVNYINDERYYFEENTPTMKPTVSPINADVGHSFPTRVNEEKSVNTDISAVSSKPGAGFSEASAKTAFCPKEYRNYINGKCYKFAQNESNWVQAYHACIKDGGNLASARTKRELFNLLSAIQEKPGDEFWLSGSLIDGQWVWASDRLSMKMELFVENPHYEGFYCASIASELEGYNEKLCNTKAKFICEMIPSSDNFGYSGKDELLASDPSLGQEHEEYSQCPEKYNMAADISFGTCYRISSERLPWVNASNECRRDGGHLVTIKSEQEFAELLDVMKVNAFKSRHYWTAGKLSDWSWEDGDQINEDVVKINAKMCGFIAHFKRKLRGGNCVFKKYFICQITLG